MATMKSIRVQAYGGPEQLSYGDAPAPQAASGQVLVRVHAASVNPFDFKLASGAFAKLIPMTLPYTPGGDFSGLLEATGEAVYGNCPFGAYAQFLAVSSQTIAPKPAKLSHVEAASVPVAAQTAWQGLFDHGQLQRGQTVLIHAAAGGVGTFAVQLAHWKGARVLTTSSAANTDYLKSLGADQVIDYKTTPFDSAVKNVDLVFDLIGGQTQARSWGVLKPGGRLVATSQPPSQEQAAQHKVEATMMEMRATTRNLAELAQLLDAAVIKAVVSHVYALDEAANAWREILAGHTRGKIVLEIR